MPRRPGRHRPLHLPVHLSVHLPRHRPSCPRPTRCRFPAPMAVRPYRQRELGLCRAADPGCPRPLHPARRCRTIRGRRPLLLPAPRRQPIPVRRPAHRRRRPRRQTRPLSPANCRSRRWPSPRPGPGLGTVASPRSASRLVRRLLPARLRLLAQLDDRPPRPPPPPPRVGRPAPPPPAARREPIRPQHQPTAAPAQAARPSAPPPRPQAVARPAPPPPPRIAPPPPPPRGPPVAVARPAPPPMARPAPPPPVARPAPPP